MLAELKSFCNFKYCFSDYRLKGIKLAQFKASWIKEVWAFIEYLKWLIIVSGLGLEKSGHNEVTGSLKESHLIKMHFVHHLPMSLKWIKKIDCPITCLVFREPAHRRVCEARTSSLRAGRARCCGARRSCLRSSLKWGRFCSPCWRRRTWCDARIWLSPNRNRSP